MVGRWMLQRPCSADGLSKGKSVQSAPTIKYWRRRSVYSHYLNLAHLLFITQLRPAPYCHEVETIARATVERRPPSQTVHVYQAVNKRGNAQRKYRWNV